jgi:type II secretory pathway pseudopilin PulG
MQRQQGFSLLEVLIVMATVMILMAIAIPMFQDALLRANTSSLSTDAKSIYVAIKQYYVDNNTYPTTADFELDSFEPLASFGYYTGRVYTRLADGEADAYLGNQDEFWLEMTLATDNRIRFLVADSPNAPIAGGAYQDGVFLYIDGVLKQIGQSNN